MEHWIRGSKVKYIVQIINYLKCDHQGWSFERPKIGFVAYLMIILPIIMPMVIHGHSMDKDNCCPYQP